MHSLSLLFFFRMCVCVVRPDEVRDPSNREKRNFMNQIGLELECDVENIKSRELNWDGCLEDRERRKIFDTCFEKLRDNLDPTTKQTWLTNLSEKTLNGGKRLISNYNNNSDQTTIQNLRRLNSLNLNKDLIESVNLTGLSRYFQQVDEKSSNSRSINSACAGEKVNKNNSNVNKIVCLRKETTVSKPSSVQSVDNLLVAVNHFDSDNMSPQVDQQIEKYNDAVKFKWPGINGIIESYIDYTRGEFDCLLF